MEEDEGQADLAGYVHLLAELGMESIFGVDPGDPENGGGKKKKKNTEPENQTFDDLLIPDADVVIKQDFPGSVTRSGNHIFRGDMRTGSISYLTHWSPMAIAGNCMVHGQGVCLCTVPLIGADEDELIRWVGDAPCFRSAEDHMACAPLQAYTRRVRRR